MTTIETESVVLSASEWIESARNPEEGESLGSIFDGFLPPLTKGRATLLGGPPGGGKTALALQDFRRLKEAGREGVFITLEMSPSDLFERFSKQFSSDDECADWIAEFNAEVSQMYILPQEIEKVMRTGYDFVVIDHLHELPYDDRFQLEREVKRLLAMAPAHNVALLALAQLRRPDPQFPREPSMHDWRESGVFEQKASVCLQFFREDESSEEAQIWNTKNRFGQRYEPLDVYLDPQTVTFRRS